MLLNYINNFAKFFINSSLHSKRQSNNKLRHKKSSGQLSFNSLDEETETINEKLLRIKEFKYIYQKTRIPPVYFFYLTLASLSIIAIGYLESVITCLISILYPLYFSIKSLREKQKEMIKTWLQYWIVYGIFINIEFIFDYFFKNFRLFLFYKVVFLLICFLPEYNGAKYIYDNLLKHIFHKHHENFHEYSVKIIEGFKRAVLDEDIDEENQEEIILKSLNASFDSSKD